eukprot:4956010-Prymnesium_polylepis.1
MTELGCTSHGRGRLRGTATTRRRQTRRTWPCGPSNSGGLVACSVRRVVRTKGIQIRQNAM